MADLCKVSRRIKKWRRTRGSMSDRRGFTLIELLVVVLIVSILAAIAQPQMTQVIVKARAVDAIADMEVIRLAVYSYQTAQQGWPNDVSRGQVPPGLDAYLPGNFSFVKDDYTLDFDNWGGSPFSIGVTMITPDSTLGLTTLDMLASPKWKSGQKYTWVIE
jgi:prepilin-type N-terminal cleavage/methylation domain-containing protein